MRGRGGTGRPCPAPESGYGRRARTRRSKSIAGSGVGLKAGLCPVPGKGNGISRYFPKGGAAHAARETGRRSADRDSWRNNRGDKSGITRDEPGHTGKTLCNFIAWDENRRGGKSLPFSSLLDGVRVWPESLFRLSTHHGSGSVGGVLPHLGKPTVGPLAVVFFHR